VTGDNVDDFGGAHGSAGVGLRQMVRAQAYQF
jgi:hypothetical protein